MIDVRIGGLRWKINIFDKIHEVDLKENNGRLLILTMP